ncbi:MAG TPA: BrnT family toxin [Longimicrobium sp.]
MDIDVEWDPEKAEWNLRKHGVSFDEARSVLEDPLSFTVFDEDHSEAEDRELLLGRSVADRLLIVSITIRGERIRIISAREMTPREKRRYERNL